MKDSLKKIFNEVYLKVSGVEYNFGNKSVEKTLDNFIKKLPNNLDEDFLWNFTLFQFSYYDGMETRFDRIYVNWIYGYKALARWKVRTIQQSYYADEFRKKFGIVREQAPMEISSWKSLERGRFTDLNLRLYHCGVESLWDENCKECKECDNFNICKEIEYV